MSIKSNLQKGKDLENFVADLLNQYGIDTRAIRQKGSGSGKAKGDIHTDAGFTIECKNTKRFDWKSAADQVKREAMGYQKEMIIWHPPQRPMDESVAIVNVHEIMFLLKFWKDHQGREGILDKFTIKNNLEKAVFHLKNVVKEL